MPDESGQENGMTEGRSKRSVLEFFFEPSHREVAIQFFFVSLVLLVVGGWLCVHDYRVAVVGVGKDATARGFAFLISYGVYGMVFGGFGNLLVPLQTGAGRSSMRFSARIGLLLFVGSAICFLCAISIEDQRSAEAARWLRTAGSCLCLSMILVGGQFFSLAVLGRCRGMTFSRFPMAARAFAYLGIPLALVGVFTGLGAWAFDGGDSPAWEAWFYLGPKRSFWSALMFGIGGISVFVVGSMLFDVLAGLGRKPLQSRFLAAFAGIFGGYAVVVSVFVFPSDSDFAGTVTTGMMLFIFICAAVLSVTLVLSLIPRTFRAYPALYFVWSVPILFFGAMMRSAEGLHILFLVALVPAIFAATYYWYPRMFRRNLNQTVGRIHFWLSLVSVLIVLGAPILRSEGVRELQAVGLLMFLAAQFPYVINVVASSFPYGNRIFVYPAILFAAEVVCGWLPFIEMGVLEYLWGAESTFHWVASGLLTMLLLGALAVADWQLMRVFPSKREHLRSNRWVAIATLMVSFPLVMAPLFLSDEVFAIGDFWSWLIVLGSSVLGLMYALKRGNRLVFGDPVIDNPWRAQSLEWYERTPAEAAAGFDAFDPSTIEVFRGAYEFAEPGAADDFMPQWLHDPTCEGSTA